MKRISASNMIYNALVKVTINVTASISITSELDGTIKNVLMETGKLYTIVYRDEIDRLTKELVCVEEIVKDTTDPNKSYVLCTIITPTTDQKKYKQVMVTIPFSNIHDLSYYTAPVTPPVV